MPLHGHASHISETPKTNVSDTDIEYTEKVVCMLSTLIIINFSGAYILRNLSSEVQQNRIIKHNCEQGRASQYQNKGQPHVVYIPALQNTFNKSNIKLLHLICAKIK